MRVINPACTDAATQTGQGQAVHGLSPRSLLLATALAAATISAVDARDLSPTCDELAWSAQMLDTNPDIREACQGVYVKDKTFYAKVRIEVARASGNRLSFKPILRDGRKGALRSLVVSNDWRANIEGQSLRLGQLQAGQRLSVYVPEDRFALIDPQGESE